MTNRPDGSASAFATREAFGALPDGRLVEAIRLGHPDGIEVRLISYGASIQQLMLPDRDGQRADVVLGYAGLADYLDRPQYFGATVGRVANRIANGRFVLDGVTYQLPINDGPNSLHGGPEGFDKQLWEIVKVGAGEQPSVTFRHVSPDGEQGYPGTLTALATYTLEWPGVLRLEYEATTDRPTIVNLSNHSYWNLAGEGSAGGAMDHRLVIPAETYTPTDRTAIPTGLVAPVEHTPFDFREWRRIGDCVRDAADQQIAFGRGYDHNWVITNGVTLDLHRMARVDEPVSGRAMEIWSNQPGLQFYSGNFLDGTSSGKAGALYRQGDALVFEPQMFPDTPNHPAFGSLRLNPGQTYRNIIEYRFAVGDPTG